MRTSDPVVTCPACGVMVATTPKGAQVVKHKRPSGRWCTNKKLPIPVTQQEHDRAVAARKARAKVSAAR